MGILSGSGASVSKLTRTVIKSVLVTASSGGNASILIYDGKDQSAEARLKVYALQSDTNQVNLNGLVFEQGVLIVPNSNVDFFLVEYGE